MIPWTTIWNAALSLALAAAVGTHGTASGLPMAYADGANQTTERAFAHQALEFPLGGAIEPIDAGTKKFITGRGLPNRRAVYGVAPWIAAFILIVAAANGQRQPQDLRNRGGPEAIQSPDR